MGWEIIIAGAVVFGAGIIRGYSGFGFALICAIALTMIFPPTMVTPIILCMDIGASLWLFYKVRQSVDWNGLKYIGAGALLTLPAGTLALKVLPVTATRIFISLVVLALSIALLRQKNMIRSSGARAAVPVGMASGFLTGIAAIGGPPVVLFYFSSDRPVAVSRASMIAFFLVADTLALLSCVYHGLIGQKVMVLTACLVIPLGAGIWIGNYLFTRYHNEDAFRKQVIFLLILLAVGGLLKAALFS